jgi:hypothetical protein
MTKGIVLVFVGVTLLGCDGHRLERECFRQPLADRLERLRARSLDDQYRIFRYGNDVIEPPLTDLANPIAERGKAAIPFLLARLMVDTDDFSVRDILLVLGKMTSSKTYDVKSDVSVMTALSSRISGMKAKEWRTVCQTMLERIKDG